MIYACKHSLHIHQICATNVTQISAPISINGNGCCSQQGEGQKKKQVIRLAFLCGSPCWTRTNDLAVNSRSLLPTELRRISFPRRCLAWDLYDESFRSALLKKIRQRPTLPGRLQPSTIGAVRLNFCVRDENRWFPYAIVTGIRWTFLARSQLHTFKVNYLPSEI